MYRIVFAFLCLVATAGIGCAGTSYGAATDGIFPTRPAGADYPNWEYMCVMIGDSGTSKTLNDSGDKGWELVTMGPYKGETMMCFKREKKGE